MTGTAGKGVDETLEELLLPTLPPLSLLLLDSPQPVRGSPSPMAGRLGPSHGHAITSSHALQKPNLRESDYTNRHGHQIDSMAFPFLSQFRYLEPI